MIQACSFKLLTITTMAKNGRLRLGCLVSTKIASDGKNFVFSPLSISSTLALAAAGSAGETLNQFLSFLECRSVDELNEAAKKVLVSIRSTPSMDGGDATMLAFATGLWVDLSVQLRPEFGEIAGLVYGAKAEPVDFQSQASEVLRKVNAWVEEETKGCINKLLPDDSVNQGTRLVLANAIYFKGVWKEKFDKSRTRDGAFHLLDGRTVNIPFMSTSKDQYISSFEDFKVLKLPYKSGEESRKYSMVIFLPQRKDDFNSLVDQARSHPNFICKHVPCRSVPVGSFLIPKFKISSEFEASDTLQELGLRLPFTERADFGQMVSIDSPKKHLSISGVYHKATIEVEEEGTIAAAATGITIMPMCYIPPVDFEANHPFIFAIIEDVTMTVLFFGHIVNPMV